MDTATDSRKAGADRFAEGLEHIDGALGALEKTLWVRINRDGLPQALPGMRNQIQAAAAYIRGMEEWLAWARATGKPIAVLTDPPELFWEPNDA